MIISEILKRATLKLENAGIDTPRLDAMILLENILEKDRSFLIANSERTIAEKDLVGFDKLLSRRLKREPISQIVGKKEFYGRDFRISRDVLTPRPETELIIDAALKRYAKDSEISILDLGTGSGCILLTLLAELPLARGVGVDKSKSALAIAAKNAYDLNIERVEFVNSDWCKNLKPQRKFSLIVSNPPYIPKREQDVLDAELGYEPETALFGGDDGLECYRQLASEISSLNFDYAIFEIGMGQELEIEKIFERYQLKLEEVIPDIAGINRIMVFKNNPNNPKYAA